MGDFAIRVDKVYKSFKLPHERQQSIKGALINFKKRGYEKQEVLSDISFEVKKGEFFGIVGRNGSGKSTMLKLLAGIYRPDSGQINIRGKLTPFIELGVGFNPELTGHENVYLNGALLGFSRKEVAEMYDEIVEFAEIERFMDQKLKNYSSGMQVRLAFSIAIRAKSDILLIDEVLAVGDFNFQAKCLAVFENLKKQGTTIIFISHDMESVRRFCDRVVLIEHGVITQRGDTQEVIDEYMKLNAETVELDPANPYGIQDASTTKGIAKILDSVIRNTKGAKIDELLSDRYVLECKFEILKDCDDVVPGVVLRNQSGMRVTASNSNWIAKPLPKLKKGQIITTQFEFENVLEHGLYYLSTNLSSSETNSFYDWSNDAAKFFVKRDFLTGGVVNPTYIFSYEFNDTNKA